MSTSVYAAPYELAPGRPGWLLVHRDAGSLRRVDHPSDWLLTTAAAGQSPNTLKSKAEALALWWRWCVDSNLDPLRVNAVTFAKFVMLLQTVPKGLALTTEVRGLPNDDRLRSDATVGQRVIHIKAFYSWAMNEGRVSVAAGRAVTGFKTPRITKRMRAPRLSDTQLPLLTSLNLSPRNQFLVELLYGAGLREGEALGLHIVDMCLNPDVAAALGCAVPAGPHVHVRRRLNPNGALAKSPFERVVPLLPRVLTAHRNWQAWAYDNAPVALESPFVVLSLAGSTRGGPFTVSGFHSMWSAQVRSKQGLENVNPHVLRHSFASELADVGVKPLVIQELLGHRCPDSTALYTHHHMNTLVSAVTSLGQWRKSLLGVA